ncbi:1359_t:CDS:2, partial [Acaulospora colombiana]
SDDIYNYHPSNKKWKNKAKSLVKRLSSRNPKSQRAHEGVTSVNNSEGAGITIIDVFSNVLLSAIVAQGIRYYRDICFTYRYFDAIILDGSEEDLTVGWTLIDRDEFDEFETSSPNQGTSLATRIGVAGPSATGGGTGPNTDEELDQ